MFQLILLIFLYLPTIIVCNVFVTCNNYITQFILSSIGIFQSVGTLGPALGYLVGGMFLDIYTDFTSVDADE